jgi:hypothetical protein
MSWTVARGHREVSATAARRQVLVVVVVVVGGVVVVVAVVVVAAAARGRPLQLLTRSATRRQRPRILWSALSSPRQAHCRTGSCGASGLCCSVSACLTRCCSATARLCTPSVGRWWAGRFQACDRCRSCCCSSRTPSCPSCATRATRTTHAFSAWRRDCCTASRCPSRL